jgi:hypothetical protein
MNKFQQAIDNAWNAGLTLSQANRLLSRRFTYEVSDLVKEWRARKKEFRCACIRRRKPKPPTAQELSALVGNGMTYGDWLGATGPGKQLRDTLSRG